MLRILCLILAAQGSVVLAQGTVALPGFNDQTINGRGSGGGCPTVVGLSSGLQTLRIGASSFAGSAIIAALSPQLACAALPLPGPWSVDLDPSQLQVWYGGTALPPGFPPAVAGANGRWNLNLSVHLGASSRFSQIALLHPAFNAGIGTTQATEILVHPPYCPGGLSLPQLGDDNAIHAILIAPFTFYSVSWSEIWINMNGNLSFCQPSTDFTPTAGEMISGPPRIAPLWDDFFPGDPGQGEILLRNDAQGFCVEWRQVRSFGVACGSFSDENTFALNANRNDGSIDFSYGLTRLCDLGTPSNDPLVGISPGGLSGCSPPGGAPPSTAIDLATGGVPNYHLAPLASTALFEEFGSQPTGSFDLSRSGSAFLHFTPVGGPGTGPYLQH